MGSSTQVISSLDVGNHIFHFSLFSHVSQDRYVKILVTWLFFVDKSMSWA